MFRQQNNTPHGCHSRLTSLSFEGSVFTPLIRPYMADTIRLSSDTLTHLTIINPECKLNEWDAFLLGWNLPNLSHLFPPTFLSKSMLK